MHNFGTKKSRNLLGQKITQPLGTKRNHPTSWDKKITQPLGTKKITEPLGTEKNHTTSRDKKIRPHLEKTKKSRNLFGQKKSCKLSGQIASKLINKAPNCTKFHQVCPNGSK